MAFLRGHRRAAVAATLGVLLLAGCSSSKHAARSSGPTLSDLQRQFESANQPFVKAVDAKAGMQVLEQTAAKSGHALGGDPWPTNYSGDVGRLQAVYTGLSVDGTNASAVNSGLTYWRSAYDRLARDLSLPQLGG